MRHLDLFSGIGGFSLASDRVWDGVKHVFCDKEPFAKEALRKHWPKAKIYDDIKRLDGTKVGAVDLVTGGFPCQPFSSAGKRLGTEDDRHLWPDMLRVIRESRPRWIIGENVAGLLTWNGGLVLDEIYSGLEDAGYEVLPPLVVPACAVNAPHRRDRVWVIAYAAGIGNGGRTADGHRDTKGKLLKGERKGRALRGKVKGRHSHAPNTYDPRREGQELLQLGRAGSWGGGRGNSWGQNWHEIATKFCGVDDGLPARVDGIKLSPKKHREARLEALGNAIVPQVAEMIMRHIRAIDPEML